MEMKLTPTRTSTTRVFLGKVTYPARTSPSPSNTPCFFLPRWEIPAWSNGTEKRATKYPLNDLAGSSSDNRIRLRRSTIVPHARHTTPRAEPTHSCRSSFHPYTSFRSLSTLTHPCGYVTLSGLLVTVFAALMSTLSRLAWTTT